MAGQANELGPSPRASAANGKQFGIRHFSCRYEIGEFGQLRSCRGCAVPGLETRLREAIARRLRRRESAPVIDGGQASEAGRRFRCCLIEGPSLLDRHEVALLAATGV